MNRRPIDPGTAAAAIVGEELAIFERVQRVIGRHSSGAEMRVTSDYDADLIALRDEAAEAKTEDLPQLIEQMSRVAAIAAGRRRPIRAAVDPASPYFAHLRLRSAEQVREILIGKRGLIDRAAGVQIVDWRDAPVSQIYYRYDEGDDYDEVVDNRTMEGVVDARRNISIQASRVRRIGCPQGIFLSDGEGRWFETDPTVAPKLEGGQGKAPRYSAQPRTDHHLPEIAALIDRHQFDLISEPSSGFVVIQGGAGSGKTTVALHRVAFLIFHDSRRFRPSRCLVVVPSAALERYVSGVLPSLNVKGVPVVTIRGWLQTTRRKVMGAFQRDRYSDDTPPAVMRVKKHPALLSLIEQLVEGWGPRPRKAVDVQEIWGELLTDRARLRAGLPSSGPRAIGDGEIAETIAWVAAQLEPPAEEEFADSDKEARSAVDGGGLDDSGRGRTAGCLDLEDDALLLRIAQLRYKGLFTRGSRDPIEYDHISIDEAQDLSAIETKVLIEATVGSRSQRSVTIAGDTAQRVVFDNGFSGWSDLLQDVGVGAANALPIRPLLLSYRSTDEVMGFAESVLGSLADTKQTAPRSSVRSGAPVQLHQFEATGEAVAFLADVLRSLGTREPMASVALIARYPAQADLYYGALRRAEVGGLRRVSRQDFTFTPGVDVTDVAQVKGLEFDYVVLLDVTAANYPDTIEARHLLHIAATRAAHQLWLTAVGPRSQLLLSAPGVTVPQAM